VRRPPAAATASLAAALAAAAVAAGCGADEPGEPGEPNRIAPPEPAATTTAAASGEPARTEPARPPPAPPAQPARPAQPALRLSVAQLAGQHLVFPFAGRTVPDALTRRIRSGRAAGVVLFARNLGAPPEVRALTARLRRIPRPAGLRAPLLVMVDQEGGPVRRLPGAPRRTPRELAAAGSARLARTEGVATARTLRGAGANVDLAPVLDVPRRGGAIARERRALGSSPAAVARVGGAFAAGLQAGGVAATAKHFPGFGAARRNTDAGPAVVGLPVATLRAVDAAPFAAAVRGGVRLVMLASATYPALAPVPAVLSGRVVRRELRGRLGFRGVTISDDLEAPALAPHGGTARAAVRAARAGVDLLLFARSYAGAAGAARAVARALRSGRLSRPALERGLRRILALRAAVRR
jgi:beta-N-acetylhexosaminidase